MKRKTRNKILKTITTIAIFVFFLGACSDGEDLRVPIIMFGTSGAWLLIFCAANGE